jgi:hypothetical protein
MIVWTESEPGIFAVVNDTPLVWLIVHTAGGVPAPVNCDGRMYFVESEVME